MALLAGFPKPARAQALLCPENWPSTLVEELLLRGDSGGLSIDPFVTAPSRATVASTNFPFSVYAGSRALAIGGSAADAAVVTALVQIVQGCGAYVSAAGVAVGLVHRADLDPPTAYFGNYRVPTNWQHSDTGAGTVLIPGCLALLRQLHCDHGRLPWRALAEPAIWLAERGLPITRSWASILLSESKWLGQLTDGADFFAADGRTKSAGQLLYQRSLAQSLRNISEDVAWFYRDWAQDLARQTGLTELAQDFEAYRPQVQSASLLPFGKVEIATLGSPSLGGTGLGWMARILQEGGYLTKDSTPAEVVFWSVLLGRLSQVRAWSHKISLEDALVGFSLDKLPRRSDLQRVWSNQESQAGEFPSHGCEHSATILASDTSGLTVNLIHSSNSSRTFGASGYRIGGILVPGSASNQRKLVESAGPQNMVPDVVCPAFIRRNRRLIGSVSMTGAYHEQATFQRLWQVYQCGLSPLQACNQAVPGGREPDGSERFDPNRFTPANLDTIKRMGLKISLKSTNPLNWLHGELETDGWSVAASNGVAASSFAPK